jgi:hypothetical protein
MYERAAEAPDTWGTRIPYRKTIFTVQVNPEYL